MAKSESATAFLRRLTGSEEISEAKEMVENAIKLASIQKYAFDRSGILSIMIIPNGAFMHSVSPHLLQSIKSIDSIDKALSDVQAVVRETRKNLIELEIEKRTSDIVKKQEESNG